MKLSALGFFPEDPEVSGTLPEPCYDQLKEKMATLVDEAIEKGVFIRIDMEYFIHKDATLRLFKELLEEKPKRAEHLGMVFQAYLKDSLQDAREMVKWANTFKTQHGFRVSLRVVKGANIAKDAEHARQGLHASLTDPATTWHGHPRDAMDATGADRWAPGITPVAKDLETTQEQFIEIIKLFEQNTNCLDVAYGTMNPDTIAHIMQTWLSNGEDLEERQIQTLFGMYNSLSLALKTFVSHRRYVPYGLLGKIIGYMRRRFIELQRSQGGKQMMKVRHNDTEPGVHPLN